MIDNEKLCLKLMNDKIELKKQVDILRGASDLYLYELMDRASVIVNTFEDSLRHHPALKEHDMLEPLVRECASSLMRLYQVASTVLIDSGRDPRNTTAIVDATVKKLGE